MNLEPARQSTSTARQRWTTLRTYAGLFSMHLACESPRGGARPSQPHRFNLRLVDDTFIWNLSRCGHSACEQKMLAETTIWNRHLNFIEFSNANLYVQKMVA
jgi:hypothetical protein